ncbi:hypothetical protein [Sodalis ligni]|uniref:Uncharacterized protein n=1 Tax=Sodalis ligni TaxID=2697027 RepID=A0A4R1N570_9GAMM|nr:hypothetical protein [Sodalis ligni]TCL02345.1 hypothetical protein EZJ58_0358 [Sodalis ligni]
MVETVVVLVAARWVGLVVEVEVVADRAAMVNSSLHANTKSRW